MAREVRRDGGVPSISAAVRMRFVPVVFAVTVAAVLVFPTARAQQPAALETLGQVGGRVESIADAGDRLVAGVGPRLIVLSPDAPDPALPLGASALLPATVHSVAVAEGHAFAALGRAGLVMADLTAGADPMVVGSLTIEGGAGDVAAADGYAFVAARSSGVSIVDVGAPDSPTLVASASVDGVSNCVAAMDGLLVVGTSEGLTLVDRRVPTSPRAIGHLRLGDVSDVSVVDDLVVAVIPVGQGSGLHVVDTSVPDAPRQLSRLDVPQGAVAVEAAGGTAFVATLLGGLTVIDIADPVVPAIVGQARLEGGANGVLAKADRVYLAGRAGGVAAWEVADPTSPLAIGAFQWPGALTRIAACGSTVLARNEVRDGLWVVDGRVAQQPRPIAPVPGLDSVRDVHCDAARAYVAGRGMSVLDVVDPEDVRVIGTFFSDGPPLETIHVSNGQALATRTDLSGTELLVIDVTDADGASLRSRVPLPGPASDVFLAEELGFATTSDGVYVVDLQDPAAGRLMGLAPLSTATSAWSWGETLLAVSPTSGLVSFRTGDGSSPAALGRARMPGARRLLAWEGAALVAGYESTVSSTLWLVDARDPAVPAVYGRMYTAGQASDVSGDAVLAWVADGDGGLRSVGVPSEMPPTPSPTEPQPLTPDPSPTVGPIATPTSEPTGGARRVLLPVVSRD